MSDKPQTVTVRLDVEFTLKDGATFLDAMNHTRDLIAKANENGKAAGVVAFGRQKFPLG